MVRVNGCDYDINGKSIAEYLADKKYDCKRIAVELNGEIVFKSNYSDTILKDNDCMEIVSFVGGG